MRTHVKSFPQIPLRSVSLANEFGAGRFAGTTKREAVRLEPLTLAEGESLPSQMLCGKPASVNNAPAVKNGQFVKRFTRY
jgi:hypothetical protein